MKTFCVLSSLAKTRRYQSSSFNSSWLKLFMELCIATTVAPWISLKVSPSIFCSSKWTLHSTIFFTLWMALRDQLKRNTISKNKSFQRKSGNKVDILETTCDSWSILCFAPLFTSIHSSVLLLQKIWADYCTSPSNQKPLRGKKACCLLKGRTEKFGVIWSQTYVLLHFVLNWTVVRKDSVNNNKQFCFTLIHI